MSFAQIHKDDALNQLEPLKHELLYNASICFFERDNWTVEEMLVLIKEIDKAIEELRRKANLIRNLEKSWK